MTNKLLMIMASVCSLASASKILMIPFLVKSQVNYFNNVARALMNDGNEVHMLMSSAFEIKPGLPDDRIHVLIYQGGDSIEFLDSPKHQKTIIEQGMGKTSPFHVLSLMRNYSVVSEQQALMCLGDTRTMEKIRENKYDLVISNGFVMALWQLLIPYKLGIPYAMLSSSTLEYWPSRIPALPSVNPIPLSHGTDEMTFFQRIMNTILMFMYGTMSTYFHPHNYLTAQLVPEKPYKMLYELSMDAQIWLVDVDPGTLDYPRPGMQNVVYLGGMSPRPGKPLPKEVADFMDAATDGVVVVSFGSVATYLPEVLTDRLFDAFSRVNYKIIMRYNGSPVDEHKLPPNRVKLMKWLPQNDLLAHPNTRVFISHCGSSGGYEALYHGVPVIGIPLLRDQHYNAKRLEKRGYGKILPTAEFSVDDLVETINELATGKSVYTANIRRGSEIYKDKPVPLPKLASFWIEHVIKYGGDHLQSHGAKQLYWFQYYMLDILVFISLMLHLTVYINYKILMFLYRKCRAKTKPTQAEEKKKTN